MTLDSSYIKELLENSNSKILVEKILKNNEYETTAKVYISKPDGHRIGPFIQKKIDKNCGLGQVYSILAEEQTNDTASKKLTKNSKEKYLANILSFKENEDYISILQEYLQGTTLEEYLKTKHPQKDLLKVMTSLCQCVNYLHTELSSAIIHRDIKPTNIIVDHNDTAKLIDFGIARIYKPDESNFNKDEISHKERDTKIFGTVGYAPPEQFGFSQTTPRSDIYSLGKVLELLFDNCEKQSKVWNGLKKAVCGKCCELDPENRFKSVSEILNLLNSADGIVQKCSKVISSDKRVSNKLSFLWIIYNTTIICLYIWMTVCTIGLLFSSDSSYLTEYGLPYCIIQFLVIDIFIFLPVAFLLLKKDWFYKRFPNLPKITFKRGLIIVCVCIICITLLMFISELIK